MITPVQAHAAIREAAGPACKQINAMARRDMLTRGGRLGSGLATTLEYLWGTHVSRHLRARFEGDDACELGWIAGDQYNDYALVSSDGYWDQATRGGELLRVEVKSMRASAEEPKAHFDQLVRELTEHDLLLVLVWDWTPAACGRAYPEIRDHFLGAAVPVARLRDALHEARGGTFVDAARCPDCRDPAVCRHHGEPLNAAGRRERSTGPDACRSNLSTSAANFGGMLRMLRTETEPARAVFRHFEVTEPVAAAYIEFVHRNFSAEEFNQYTLDEWRELWRRMGQPEIERSLSKHQIAAQLRDVYPDLYRKELRRLLAGEAGVARGRSWD